MHSYPSSHIRGLKFVLTLLICLLYIQHKIDNFLSGLKEDPNCFVGSKERQLSTWFHQELEPLFKEHGFSS